MNSPARKPQWVKVKKQSLLKSFIVLIPFCLAFTYMGLTVETTATATLVYPRLGSALRGPPTCGPGLNTTDFLDETIVFWVGPEPAETVIPQAWSDKHNWQVAITPAVMPTANCTPLPVIEVFHGRNDNVLFGGGMDVNPLVPTAVGIRCRVPADIPPVTYNLAIGFKQPITPELQGTGAISLIPTVGSWRGPRGSGGSQWFGEVPFLLSERNAVVFPWIHDARSGDALMEYDGKPVKQFNVMHVTDIHFDYTQLDWLVNNARWMLDASIFAPDVIVITGDVMESPGDEDRQGASQYELAYAKLASMNLPLIMTSGNHDNRNLGPWRHYFGPLFSATRHDDLTIVALDSTLPLNTGVLHWIETQSTPVKPGAPVIQAFHYNPDPGYFQSAWIAIIDILTQKNLTAALTGHTHRDLVTSVATLRDALLSNPEALLSADEEDIATLLGTMVEVNNSTTKYLDAICEPTLLNTRSASKRNDVVPQLYDFLAGPLNYSGYRILTVQGNKVYNYTYDWNGDGQRDPQVSYPVGLFNVSYIFDAGIGVSPTANATWILNNTSTENVRSARAIFEVPLPPAGYQWGLIAANLTAGAYIRTRVMNSTHAWIEARVPAPRNVVTRLCLTPVS